MNNIVSFWNKKAIALFDKHQNPGDDARIMAVFQMAIHNTLNQIQHKYQVYDAVNLSVSANGPYSVKAAVSAAAKTTLLWAINTLNQSIYNNTSNLINNVNEWYGECVNTLPNVAEKLNGIALGEQVAAKIIERANNDGRVNVLMLSNKPDGNAPNLFRADYYNGPIPSNPTLNKFLVNWGEKVRPFCTQSNDQFQQNGPKGFGTSNYSLEIHPDAMNDIEEVYKWGVKEEFQEAGVSNFFLSGGIKAKTLYWADVRQHVILNNFALKVIEQKNPTIDDWDLARVLALIHTGMADGISAVLNDLYFFYHWRPISAMKFLNKRMIDSANSSIPWEPFIFPLPRVPEYPSAFGVLGGIVGEILISLYGDSISLALTPEINYDKISKAVEDNALTKIYSGWNFRKSSEDGLKQGKKIAKFIMKNHFVEQKKIPKGFSKSKPKNPNLGK